MLQSHMAKLLLRLMVESLESNLMTVFFSDYSGDFSLRRNQGSKTLLNNYTIKYLPNTQYIKYHSPVPISKSWFHVREIYNIVLLGTGEGNVRDFIR